MTIFDCSACGKAHEQQVKRLLLEASDTQMDACMKPLVEKWDDEPTALQILEVLDHCIFGSLASGFVIRVLQAAYDSALKREEKTHEEMIPLATWRAVDAKGGAR